MKTEAQIRKEITELTNGIKDVMKVSRHSLSALVAGTLVIASVSQEIKALKWVLDEKVELP